MIFSIPMQVLQHLFPFLQDSAECLSAPEGSSANSACIIMGFPIESTGFSSSHPCAAHGTKRSHLLVGLLVYLCMCNMCIV